MAWGNMQVVPIPVHPNHRSTRPITGQRCHPCDTTCSRAARAASLARPPIDGLSSSARACACLCKNRAQRRHTATSGWEPSLTSWASGNSPSQHQQRERRSCATSAAAAMSPSSAPFGRGRHRVCRGYLPAASWDPATHRSCCWVRSEMHWVCVVNPRERTTRSLAALLLSAHGLATRRHDNRQGRPGLAQWLDHTAYAQAGSGRS
jgi:hypothetical protein